jgi:hypothetical protein
MAEAVVQPYDEIGRYSMFFPIKVVNGFVACDFMLGCYCCKFCLNRRYPDWHRLLEAKKVYRNSMQVAQAAGLLKKTKALTHARVTLKFGHDTDMSLEESEVQQLYKLMPADHPIVFMRRGRLMPEHRPFYMQARPNLLVELTLTPRSKFLEYKINPFPILDSFKDVACNMFYTVGPVCEDNYEEAREIIRAIPTGSNVWVRELIVKDIPKITGANKLDYHGEELRKFALERGHIVVSYLNCVVRAGVGLGFHKRGEFDSEPNTWQLQWAAQHCQVIEQCSFEETEEQERSRIHPALDDLGLTLARPLKKFAHKSYAVLTNEEVNFGDDCYLRELTSLKIDLWKEGMKTGTALTQSIAARWKEVDFFPVDEMIELARDSYALAFPE